MIVSRGEELHGGRERPSALADAYEALLGAIVIGSISNGMDLLGLESDIKFIITGGVLLLAVTIDALARRTRESAR